MCVYLLIFPGRAFAINGRRTHFQQASRTWHIPITLENGIFDGLFLA